MELRKAGRYCVSALAFFWWEQPDGTIREDKGTTSDVSSCGVSIATDAAPSVGTHVRIEVYLPPAQFAGHAARLEGEGKVVRIEPKDEATTKFAAEVEFQTRPPLTIVSHIQ
jgi:hypothetical protein